MASDGIDALRASQVGSSAAAQAVARLFQFASLALIVRLVVRGYGPEAWGTLATVMAVAGLVALLDFSAHELTAFLVATSGTIAELKERLGKALTFCVFPAVAGSVVVSAIVAAGPLLLPHATTPAEQLRWLLASVLAMFLLALPLWVLSGTLQGLGWLRELNVANAVESAVELLVVVACVYSQQDLITLQWARTLRLVARGAVLLVILLDRKIPLPRPGRLDRETARPLFSLAAGYSVARGLGLAVYRAPVLLATAALAPAMVGAIAAADQVASLAYRVSHPFYESLFHRFARYLGPGAPQSEREQGQRQLVGMTAILAGLVAVPGLGLCLLGGWIFRMWLGTDLPLAANVLPWLTFAWVLNAVGSPSSCALLATDHSRQSVVAHLAAIAVNIGAAFAFGRSWGGTGLAAATFAANLVLLAGLLPQAAAVAGVAAWRASGSLFAIAAIVAAFLLMFRDVSLHPMARAVAGASLAGVAVLGLLRSHPDILALLKARTSPTV